MTEPAAIAPAAGGRITRLAYKKSKARRLSATAYQVGKRWAGFIIQAQNGYCAGCGQSLPNERRKKLNPRHADFPTLDHLVPKCVGGAEHPTNKVAMHRKCNERKASRMPTGCERIWGAVVAANFAKIGYEQW